MRGQGDIGGFYPMNEPLHIWPCLSGSGWTAPIDESAFALISWAALLIKPPRSQPSSLSIWLSPLVLLWKVWSEGVLGAGSRPRPTHHSRQCPQYLLDCGFVSLAPLRRRFCAFWYSFWTSHQRCEQRQSSYSLKVGLGRLSYVHVHKAMS